MEGWVKYHRKILENDIWYDVTSFRLFTYLLLQASHQDGVKINGIEVNKGQYIRSYSKLAEDLAYKEGRGSKKLAKSTISKSVKKLVDSQMIETKDTEYGTLFTIVNYCKYQDSGNIIERNQEKAGTTSPPEEINVPAFDQIEGKFIQQRGSGLNISASDAQAINEVLRLGIPLETILKWMDTIYQHYIQRNNGRTIRAFKYYEEAIKTQQQKLQQPKTNVTPFPKPKKENSIDALARYAQKHGVKLGGTQDGNT
ncbi:hypothetical protein [Priestia megaterium]|uniref:hypothetical protein n=1 Tax=Priestia megaterium TaxID=1404 RepID=UPI001CDD212D|nr:hypothetical protein [Priestia megaterium]MCA4157680.1 hypothetical protein [Priestia megaterium]